MTSYSVSVDGKTFRCGKDEYILDKAQYNNIDMPYSCRAGSCATCLCILKEGQVDQSDGSFLTNEQMSAGLVLACVAKPEADVALGFASDQIKDLMNQGSLSDTIDSNVEASWHYFFGGGTPVALGQTTIDRLIGSDRHQQALANLHAGNTRKSGNYGVDMTTEMFHVGDTAIVYDTVCSGGFCTTVFTGFVQAVGVNAWVPDGVWDVFDLEENFGIEGIEVPYGKPYSYIPHVWIETFPDPGVWAQSSD